MKIYPPEPEIGEFEGFAEPNDIFGYADFGGRLANLVLNLDDPSVLLLDDDWGTGKTTFVKQWAGLMRQRGVPVIHFDAFANDFQNDAFIALSRQIIAASKSIAPKQKKSLIEKSKVLGAELVPLLTKAAIHLGTGGAIDKDQQDQALQSIKDAFSKSHYALQEVIGAELAQAEDQAKALDNFRDALSELAVKLAVKSAKKAKKRGFEGAVEGAPLVFIIDELDRCRPEFAIEILERIKHIFSVKNVQFLLVANFSHLSSMLPKVARESGAASAYLEKFIQLKLNLPAPGQHQPYGGDPDNFRRQIYIGYIWKHMALACDDSNYDSLVRESVKFLANKFDLKLRSLERLATYVNLLYAATKKGQFRIPILAVGLCMIKLTNRSLFLKAKNRTLTFEEVASYFQFEKWNEKETRITRYKNLWRYCLSDSLPEADWVREIDEYWSGHLLEREEAIPVMASFFEDFIVVN